MLERKIKTRTLAAKRVHQIQNYVRSSDVFNIRETSEPPVSISILAEKPISPHHSDVEQKIYTDSSFTLCGNLNVIKNGVLPKLKIAEVTDRSPEGQSVVSISRTRNKGPSMSRLSKLELKVQ